MHLRRCYWSRVGGNANSKAWNQKRVLRRIVGCPTDDRKKKMLRVVPAVRDQVCSKKSMGEAQPQISKLLQVLDEWKKRVFEVAKSIMSSK